VVEVEVKTPHKMVLMVDQVVVDLDLVLQQQEVQEQPDKALTVVEVLTLILVVFMEVVEVEGVPVPLELMEKKDRMYLGLQEMEEMAKHIQFQELLRITPVVEVEVIGVII
jgi:hypothetical protein